MRWRCRLLACALAAAAAAPAVAAEPAAAKPVAEVAAAKAPLAAEGAPRADKREHVVASPHGNRPDEYYWLRDDDPKGKRAEILRHLHAENAYTEAMLAPLMPLRDKLYAEMRARVRADDASVPVYEDGWWTWRQYEPGNEHPRLLRRRGSPERMDPNAKAEVLLDVPRLAIAQPYYALGAVALSPDGQWLAWTEDTSGRRSHTLYIEHLRTRRLAPERIEGVLENIVWGADSRTLYYVRQDPVTLQSGPVYRHRRGSDPAHDTLVYDEADKTLFVDVRRSASRRHVLIDIVGTDTTELRSLPAADADAAPAVVFARRSGVRAYADHLGSRWVVRTNEDAPNFRLVEVPDAAPEDRNRWRTLIAARADAAIESHAVFDRAIAIEERVDGARRVRVLGAAGEHTLDAGAASSAALGENRDPAAAHVQIVLQSLVRPPTTIDVHLASGREVVRKHERVRHYDAALYRSERVWAPARDGARIPVTLAWRGDRIARDGSAALLVEAYGAYGESYEPEFASRRVSLLDRGFVVAIAHVRGGAELGQQWYDAGRLMNKQRSFDDFVDVTDHLVAERWAARGKVFAQGTSAGGLLVAAVVNQAGAKYRGVALDVPFVDVVTTMLDPTIPLTANEWRQWGDPREKAAYEYQLRYSPYDNIAARAYPAMLVTTSLWDSQVPYYEPVKYVARLRAAKTDTNPLLLHVEMSGGHGGASGRYERLRHWARQYAFFLNLAGNGE